MKSVVGTGFLTALALFCGACATSSAHTPPEPRARISVLGVHPDPTEPGAGAGEVTVYASYAVSAFDESLSPYTLSLQFQTDEGLTIGPAFGPSNVVLSSPSGQAQLSVSLTEVHRLAPPQHLSSPLTMLVILDHASPGGTKIIGRSEPISFAPTVGANARGRRNGEITYSGGNGGDCGTAIVISGARDEGEGTRAEYEWLAERYPGYHTQRQGLGDCPGITTDVITIRLPDGTQRDVTFDISGFFGKW